MPRLTSHLVALLMAAGVASGCATHEGTLAPTIKDPIVFDDTFGAGVDYQAFLGSKYDAVGMDTTVKYDGSTSLKVTVPAVGDPAGSYAGGAFVTTPKRDLSVYNALTFWAKADRVITLDVAGFGNDNTGRSKYEARRSAIPLGTTWAKYVIPIPLPSRLLDEAGLFFFAEGPEGGAGCTMWFDDVMFENLLTITDPRPQIATATLTPDVGTSVAVPGTQVTFAVNGVDQTVGCMQGYFTFSSSNDVVATAGEGVVNVVGEGDATITAKLGTVDATGVLTLRANPAPATAPPRPTLPASDVISMLTMVYPNVTVDTWSTTWDFADVTDVTVGGDNMKKYAITSYAAADFSGHLIDATTMTAFHVDVWVPGGTTFKVKLVDFGDDGQFGGTGPNQDSQHELTFNAATTPALRFREWTSLELPMSAFAGLLGRAHLAQLLFSGDVGTAYVDNVYFHR
jgi:hypothetical protein